MIVQYAPHSQYVRVAGRVIHTIHTPIRVDRMTVRKEYSARYRKHMWVLYSPKPPQDPTARSVSVDGTHLYRTEGPDWGYIMLLANWIRVGARV